MPVYTACTAYIPPQPIVPDTYIIFDSASDRLVLIPCRVVVVVVVVVCVCARGNGHVKKGALAFAGLRTKALCQRMRMRRCYSRYSACRGMYMCFVTYLELRQPTACEPRTRAASAPGSQRRGRGASPGAGRGHGSPATEPSGPGAKLAPGPHPHPHPAHTAPRRHPSPPPGPRGRAVAKSAESVRAKQARLPALERPPLEFC
jgi:hypothetical protein